VTRALRRTHDMMAAELSRSDFAHKTLKDSTAALSSLSETYSSLDTMLSKSRDLLGTLMKSQKSDTWYLETSFTLLLATIGWLVFRRWVYGPAWWLVWLPLKLVFRGGMGISRSVSSGLHSGAGGASSQQDPVGGDPAGPGVRVTAKMNNEGVPTIKVGNGNQEKEEIDPDDTLEEVGRMIDESREQAGQEETILRERGEDEAPNPKKRMLDDEGAGPQHVEL
jgi:protein transport protein SEC20